MWIEKNGPTWRIRDIVDGRKVTIEAGWPNKTSVKKRLTTLKADQIRGDFIDPRAGKLTVAEWVERWWPGHATGLKPTSVQSEGSRLRMHIVPLLGHLTLDEVNNIVIQAWVTKLMSGLPDLERPGKWARRPLSAKTVRSCHGLLHSLMKAAVQGRKIRTNPCGDTKLPELVPKEMRFLTETEAGRLHTAVPEHWRPLVLLLVSTGLRWGEAVGLQLKNLDVLGGRLTVVRAMHEMSDGSLIFGTPKTARGRRTVTFTPKVAAALTPLVVDKARDELIFKTTTGLPVRARNFRRGWLKWVEAAGLEGLRIHDLRHTQAAWLISKNVPLSAIAQRLGHSSIAVTDGIYGHLLPEVDAGILKAVTEALEHIDPEALAAELEAETVGDLLPEMADEAGGEIGER
ncbi:tyrosine-type recombinase/integrase [Micromonospora chokoriensis]|uniref:tyrosine-type recombinase/integrase n=1 Tax=Micromonospora chokoriensis TaxID=356851 RepID=UPI0004C43398|nr:site-specific integrase [Micromonospora chokoriensis]